MQTQWLTGGTQTHTSIFSFLKYCTVNGHGNVTLLNLTETPPLQLLIIPLGSVCANKPPLLYRSEVYQNNHTAVNRRWKKCVSVDFKEKNVRTNVEVLKIGFGLRHHVSTHLTGELNIQLCPKYLWGLTEVRYIWARTQCVLPLPQIRAVRGKELGHSVHFRSP